MDRNAEFLLCIPRQVLLDKCRVEPVKSRCYRGVSSEEISHPSRSHGHVEGLTRCFHEAARTLQDGEGRMSFIQVTDLGSNPERTQQTPSSNTEEQLLLQSQFRPASVQFTSDPSMLGKVSGVIAVEQVKLHPTYLHLPGAQPD